MKPEYDFSNGIRGKYSERYRRGWTLEVFPGISIDPGVRSGTACISGTRVDVATILGALAAGETMDTVIAEFALSQQQIRPHSRTPPTCWPNLNARRSPDDRGPAPEVTRPGLPAITPRVIMIL